MTTTDLETAVHNLATAANELEKIMTARYASYQSHQIGYSSKADLALREDLLGLNFKDYSSVQCRAINAVFSAWCPPWQIPKSVWENAGQLAQHLDAIESQFKALALALDWEILNQTLNDIAQALNDTAKSIDDPEPDMAQAQFLELPEVDPNWEPTDKDYDLDKIPWD